MPLIKCKVCENMISANAEICPHCGEKNLILSKVVIHRWASMMGFMYKMDVIVDGVSIKLLGNGETFTTELPVGNHILTVSTFAGGNSTNISILPSKTYAIETGFNFIGNIDLQSKIVEE